jgi:drug/metabolite transporter (DMT)-like permease
MGKTNWSRVFLGGLLVAVVLNTLSYVYLAIFHETDGFQTFWFVFYLITGILSFWLYSAIYRRRMRRRMKSEAESE